MHFVNLTAITAPNHSQARGIRGASIPTKARLTYFQDKSLKLELQYRTEGQWDTCFETGPVVIPSVSYLGFSAETGELSDNFDIVNVQTNNLYSAATGDANKSELRNKGSRQDSKPGGTTRYNKDAPKSGGWGWFILKIVLFLGACGGAYGGYTMYRTSSKRGSRFD